MQEFKRIINEWAATVGRIVIWDGVDFAREVFPGEMGLSANVALTHHVLFNHQTVYELRLCKYKSYLWDGAVFYSTAA